VVITSPTQQQVFNSVSAPVHRGAYYIGLAPRSYVATAGAETTVDAVTVTPDGARHPEATLDVTVYEFRWNNVYVQAEDGNFYWKSSAERTPVYSTTVTTDDQGEAAIAFTPATGGQYQVTATGSDAAGNRIASAVFLWVSASSDVFVPWRLDNNDRIELVADKKLYAPGDTARILVPNPFTGTVKALVTLERSGVIEHQVIDLTGSSQTIEIPITGEHIPNIYVGVVMVKGVDESNPYPATRVGYVKLAVDTAEKELSVDGEPSDVVLRPGDTVTYTLTVRDSNGASRRRCGDERRAGRQGGAQCWQATTATHGRWSISSTTSAAGRQHRFADRHQQGSRQPAAWPRAARAAAVAAAGRPGSARGVRRHGLLARRPGQRRKRRDRVLRQAARQPDDLGADGQERGQEHPGRRDHRTRSWRPRSCRCVPACPASSPRATAL
jgi:hypothetical protein